MGKPKNKQPPSVQSQFKNNKIKDAVTKLSKSEVVEPSTAEYYSHAVLSPKPHTNKQEWRFDLDYRALNDESDFQSWPLPNTSPMFDRISSKKAK